MALSSWQKYKIDNGLQTGETEEEREYQRQLSRQRYEQYAQGSVGSKNAFERKVELVKAQQEQMDAANKQYYSGNAQMANPQSQAAYDSMGFKDVEGVMNGTATPLSLKTAQQRYDAANDQVKGLLHAYSEKYGYENPNGTKTNDFVVDDPAKANALGQIMSKGGYTMEQTEQLRDDAVRMNQYRQDVAAGKGGEWLSQDQKVARSYQQILNMPNDLRMDIAKYQEAYKNSNKTSVTGTMATQKNQQANAKVKANEIKNDIMSKYNLSEEDLNRYIEYAETVANYGMSIQNQMPFTIDKNASVGQKALQGAANTVYSLGSFIPGAYSSAIGHLTNGNKEMGYDTNNPYERLSNTGTYAQQQVAQNAIGDEHPVGQFLYNAGMSTLQAAEAIGVGAPFGEVGTLSMFAASAYDSSYTDAKQMGLSDSDANKIASTAAAIETATELISLDQLYNVYKSSKKAGIKMFRDVLVSAGVESTEEGASDILNRYAEYRMLNGTGMSAQEQRIQGYLDQGKSQEEAVRLANADFIKEFALDSLAGGISGLALSAPSVAMTNSSIKKERAEISDMYKEEITANKGETAEDRVALDQAKKYADNPARLQVDMMDDSTEEGAARKAKAMELADKKHKGVITNIKLNDLLTEDQMDAKAKYNQYVRDLQSESRVSLNKEEADQQMYTAAKSGDTEAMAKAYSDMKNSTSAEVRDQADQIYEQNMAVAEQAGVSVEQAEAAKISSKEAYNAALSGVEMENLSSVAQEGYNQGNIERTEAIIQMAQTKDNPTVFKENIPENVDIRQYDKLFDRTYRAAAIGLTLDQIKEDAGAVSVLGEDRIEQIYNSGADKHIQDVEASSQKIINEKLGVKKKGSGTFVDQRQKVNKDIDTSFMKAIAAITRNNIVLVDPANSNVRAQFKSSESTIYVTEDNAYQLIHELGEFADVYASKEYDDFRAVANGAAREIMGAAAFDAHFKDFHNRYSQAKSLRGLTQSLTDTSKELANDYAVALFSTEKGQKAMADYIAKHYSAEEAQTVIGKIKDFFKKIVDSLRSMIASNKYSDYQNNLLKSAALENEKNMQKFFDVLDKAIENAKALEIQTAQESASKVGLEVDADTESAYPSDRNSLASWNKSEYAKNAQKAARDLAVALDVDEEKALKYINDINSIAKMIADDRVRLDYDADPNNSSFVSNVEYGGSIDFSTICKKRLLYTGTLQEIQKKIGNRVITMQDYLDIRNAMLDDGLQTTCGCCYVEGSRVKLGQFMKEFIKRYAADNPPYVPTMYEVTMPDGIRQLRAKHPEAWKAREYFLNHMGQIEGHTGKKNLFGSQGKPKDYTERTEYRGEILEKFLNKPDYVAEKNKNGGLRLQSFSDFEIVNLIDCMQVIMDMSRCGLAGQAYTKVYEFADALGNTGLKINLSLMGAGVDSKGDLILDEVNGMSKKDAIELRTKYSQNVGTIVVAFTDEQIRAAMNSDYIDYIIPFHRSQWRKSQYEALGLPEGTKDYTLHQNDRVKKENGRLKKAESNLMPNEYWDFSKSGRENAEHYIELCNQQNKAPKFPFLLDKDAKGNYSLPADADGYFKLLIDFKMYDNEGVGSPQMPVKPNFNMDNCKKMLDDYTGGHDSFPVAKDIADKFAKKISARGDEFRYSLDSDGNSITKNQDDFFKNSKIRDDEGNLLVMYHGTANDFTVFDPVKFGGKNGKAEGYGIYLTDNPEVSKAYGGSTIKAYVNVTNPASKFGRKIKAQKLTKLIEATCVKEAQKLVDEEGYDKLSDALRDTWVSNYVYTYDMSMPKAYAETANDILRMNDNDFDVVQEVMGGLAIRDYEAAYDFYDTLKSTLGIDGFETEWEDPDNPGKTSKIVLAFDSNQVKNTDNQNPTDDPDIRFSLSDEEFIEDLLSDDDMWEALVSNELKKEMNSFDTISDLMDMLRGEIEAAPVKERKKAVKHLTRRALGDQFRTVGNKIAFTDERIDLYLKKFAASNKDYAQAYITYMTPADFILMTANGNKGSDTFDRLMKESHDFNEKEFIDAINDQPIFLDIDQENKIARVIGHEGRHRMIALQLAGYTQIPVLLFNYDNKYSKQHIDSMRLSPQRFNSDTKYNRSNEIVLSDIEPLSTGNRDNVVAKFGSGVSADIRFSLNTDKVMSSTGEQISSEFASVLDSLDAHKMVTLDEVKRIPEVADAYKRIEGLTPTIEIPGRENTWNAKVDNLIKNNGFAKAKDVVYNGDVERNHKAALVLGLPASGKSSVITDRLLKENRAMLLDSDEAKKVIDEFDDGWGAGVVHEESKEINSLLRDRVLEEGMNFVMPIVGSNYTKVSKQIQMLKKLGYDVDVHLVDVDQTTSLSRMLKRFIDQNRFLDPSLVYEYGNKPSEVFDKAKGEADEYSKWSNEVKWGEKPILIESSVQWDNQGDLGSRGENRRGKNAADLRETDEEKRYSLSTDSDGTKLSANQQKFFKDSKVVDENGNLIVLYHGTLDPGFNVFNPSFIYMSDNKYVANAYTDEDSYRVRLYDGENGSVYKMYANLVNPLVVDAAKDLSSKFDADINYNENTDKYIVKLTNTETTRTEVGYGRKFLEKLYDYKTVERIEKHFSNKKTNYKIKNRQTSIIKPSIYDNIEFNGDVYSTDEIAEYAQKNGYDGVIIRNVIDDLSFSENGRVGTDVIAFNSNQVKSVDNLNPTEDSDIRYSLDTPLDIAANFYELAYDMDDYGTLDATDWDSQSEIDAIAAAIDMGKTDYFINTLEDIILDDGEQSDRAKTLLNAINKYTDGRRYSLDLDSDEWALFETDNPVVSDKSILEEGMKALKGKNVDVRAVNKIATELKNEFGSTINRDEFSSMLQRAFAYMHKGNLTFNDLMAVFEEVARPVIDKATKIENAEVYNDFLSFFKDNKIKLSEKQMAEVKSTYGSYADYQKAMYPIQISMKGNMDLDNSWYGLAEAFPGLIDYDVNALDMPMALADVLESLRPSPVNTFGADADEVAKDLAMRIVESYFNMQTDAKLKKAAAQMREDNQKYRADVRARYQAKLNQAKHDIKEANINKDWAIAEKRDRYEKEIANIKAKSKDRMSTYRDKQKAKEQKKQISKIVSDLSERIINPTEKKHVPSDMVKPLMEFLQALNFVDPTVRYDAKSGTYKITMLDYNEKVDGHNVNHMLTLEGKSSTEVIAKFYNELDAGKGSQNQKRWQDRLNQIKNLFDKVNNFDSESADVYNMLDASMADMLSDLLQRNDSVLSINNLKTDDLITIKNALKNILKAVNDQNKAFTMKQSITDTANNIQQNAADMKKKEHTGAYHKLHTVLVMNMMTPDTFFDMIGANNMYSSLSRALEQKIEYIKQTEEFVKELIGDEKISDWTGSETTKFETSEGTLEMNVAQVMSLYELSKRQQAVLHMAGGIEVERMPVKDGVMKVYRNQNVGIHLSQDELDRILGTLTSEQKRIADGLQQYMANTCGAWGNEASMLMYDFEKFLDPTYFPISTDSDTNMTKDNDGNLKLLNGIERSGFTKAVQKNASNPIVIHDIFNVFVKHATDMASYAAYAPVIKDALRVYNYKEVIDIGDGKKYLSVKKSINDLMGRNDNAGRQYFEQFIKDINGLERAGELQTGLETLIGNYKAAAVGANIRVVVQQPTAYLRAAMLIKPKYLAEALPHAALSSKKMDALKDKNALIYWKSQGYYETNVGRSISSIITGQDTIREKLTEKAMWLAGKADDITWSCLYDAVQRQIRDENPGLSGEEFDKKVDELFGEVIHQTQVVDSTIMKAPWQRATTKTAKLSAAFMAEPIKSYNIALKSMIQATRGKASPKVVAYAFGVLLATDMLNSLAQAMIDAMRYHDDDDDYMEDLLTYWLSNMGENVNPLGRIPVIKDIYGSLISAFTGESTYGQSAGQSFDYMAISSITDAISTMRKQFTGEYNKTGYAAYMTYAKALSQLTGVPVYNFSRDAVSAWNMLAKDDLKLKKQLEKPTDKYNNIISALDSDRSDEYLTEAINKAMSKGGTVDEARNKVKNKYKSEYLDAIEDRDEDLRDQIYEKTVRGFVALGMSKSDAEAMIESWTEEKVGFSVLDKAIESGQGIDEAVEALIAQKEADGVEDPVSKILKHLYTSYGETIDFNRENGIQSDTEKNLNAALNKLDGIDYDQLKIDQTQYDNIIDALETNASDRELENAVAMAMQNSSTVKKARSRIQTEYKADYVDAFETQDDMLMKDIEDKVARAYTMMGLSNTEIENELSKWLEDNTGYSEMYKAIETGDNIDEAIKNIMAAKDTDKILDKLYSNYSSTIELDRAKGYSESEIEDRVNQALKLIDGSNYNKLKIDQQTKAKEKAEKAAATEAKTKAKEKIKASIDSGQNYKTSVDEAVKAGMEYSDVKSSITSQYKDEYITAYKSGNRQRCTTLKNRIAAVKAYCDQKAGTKIAKKYRGDYVAYEKDQIDKWVKE